MKIYRILMLLSLIVLSQMAGVIGSYFTYPQISGWYASLDKPWFAPPGWLIGAVWIVLYTLMGIAAFLVADKTPYSNQSKYALAMFGFQLAINAIWSFAFFGLQSPVLGLAVIVILWFAIVETMILFAKVGRSAAWLLAPYLLWVTFAAFLNFSIMMMNA